MQVEELRIERFLGVAEATLKLSNKGLVLIQGENQDDPSADSNGAGKSSIVDALCWCLYGVTARGVSGDAVVNRTAKKGTCVDLILHDDGDRYHVRRTRKPNGLTVERLLPGGSVTLTAGTEKETQAAIVKLMGCSQDVFMAAVYAGQEAMPDLPGMTDKQLKLLIEEAAGVQTLAEAYALARDEAAEVTRTISSKDSMLSAAETQVSQAADRLESLKAARQKFEDDRGEFMKVMAANAKVRFANAAKLKDSLSAAEKAAAKVRMAEIANKMSGLKLEQAEADRLHKHSLIAYQSLQHAIATAENWKTQLSKAEKELLNIDSRIGQPCTACGKPIAADDLEQARDHARAIVVAAKGSLKDSLAAGLDLKTKYKEAQAKFDEFKATMSDPTALVAEHAQLTARVKDIEAIEGKIAFEEGEVKRLVGEVSKKKAEVNPFDALVEKETKANEGYTKAADTLAAELATLATEANVLKDAVQVFGPAGVRAHILDTVTPFLNDRTAEYLGALSDGNITAVWSTLSKTAKGEVREKFTIEVATASGTDSFAGLSGGEKRKVRLACAMALQDLVATRATKPINLFIADEVDHALDESGLERLMGVLERKARDRGTVLVISHNSLSDWIDNVITVVKKNGEGFLKATSW